MAVTYASNVFTITQNASTAGTGTISGVPTTVTIGGISQTATLITGVSTVFTTQLRVGSLIVAGANQFIVHSITNNNSLIAFLRNNTNAGTTFTSTAFTFHAPTLWSELVTAVQGQAATIASTDGRLNIVFTDASVTTNANSVLVADLFVSLSFGAANARRLNHNADAVLIFRNGGDITFNGDIRFLWFRGWLNVPNGVLTWQNNVTGQGGGYRQDFINSDVRSNGIASMTFISSGGVAGAWRQYVLVDSMGQPPKIGSILINNNIQAPSSGVGEAIYLQFQQGTYNNVTFPNPVSTFGVTQPYLVYLSRIDANLTTLRFPSFPGDSYALAYDLNNFTNDTYLINEVWRDRTTPGTLTLGVTNGTNSGQRHHRIYEWTPGTYFTTGGWNVRLRDSQATPLVVQNGIVTANTALQMEWQMVAMINGVVTTNNYGPFRLLARKPGFVSRYETFTPTAPRTESFLPVVDATYTSDQSTRTGIAANNATNTITISSGTHTLDQVYDWFQWWLSQNSQMAAYPDVATIGSVNGNQWTLPTGWTLVINSGATLNAGAKLSYIFVPTITNNGTITSLYGTSTGNSTTFTLSGLEAGTTVYIANNAGATQFLQANQSGSVVLYIAPGATGTWSWGVYNYNNTIQSGTFTPTGGSISAVVAIRPDTNVTSTAAAANALLTSTFTINTVARTITVIANSNFDQLYDAIKSFKLTATAAAATTPAIDRLIVTPSGTDLAAAANWTLIVNNNVTLAAGTKFRKVVFNTVTLNGTGLITGLYQTSVGTSTIWTFGTSTGTGIQAGSSLAVYKADGTVLYYRNNVAAGAYSFYIPPQATGENYFYAIEKYGFRREDGFFPSNVGDSIGYVPAYSEDVGISETTQATAAAYTILDTTNKIYDAIANFRTTQAGIIYPSLVVRDGTYLDFGTYNVRMRDDAAAIVAVSGNTLTLRSLTLASTTKYNAMKTAPPSTITKTDNEVINVLIEDANGDSQLTINGGDNLGYELWKVTTSTPTDNYATGTLLTTLANNLTPYRFIGVSGFDIVGRDVNSGVRRRSSMAKGTYSQSFYVGDQIQLATNAPQLEENNEKLAELAAEIQSIKGTGFDANTDTLEKISDKITGVEGDLVIINDGVQNASLIVPHTTDLP